MQRITETQLLLLKRRSQGKTFRQMTKGTGLSARHAHDEYLRALRKAVKLIEQTYFLEGL